MMSALSHRRSHRRSPCGVLRRGVAHWLAAGVLLHGAVATALAAPGSVPDEAAQRLDALAEQGRAHPEEAAAGLVALADSLPEDAGLRIDALEQLGRLRAWMNDTEGAERAAVQLDRLAQRNTGDRASAEAAASFVRSRIVFNSGTVSRADRLMSDALTRLPAGAAPLRRLSYLLAAADIKERAGRLDDSVRLQLQGLELADTTPASNWRRSEIRSTLAFTLFEAGQKERAHALNREATDLARQANDDLAMAAALTTQSFLLADEKDEAGELDALRGAVEHARNAGAKRDEILGLANLADIYLKRRQYQTALEMSERALALSREVRNRGSESVALANIGLALISMHRKPEGMKAVQESLAIEERQGAITSMADTYAELGQYLERAGELKDAFDAYRQHRRLADEVFRQEQQQTIVELQEGFDNERRNRELELLNRQNRLNEEQLLQHELHQRLWALGAALALLSLGVVGLLVQRGRRANRLLASTNELLKVQSERDPLTGLANRRHFQQAMRQLAADGRLAGTIYLLDIDHFKHINDLHGHAAGDAVLVEIAQRLRATLREQDLVVRWGGEEFLVVVQSLSPEQVEALAQRLLAAVAARTVDFGGTPVAVSASIGFATFPLEPAGLRLSWERAIEVVDTAMYLAKAHGRNRAYGIRLLHADDEAGVEHIVRTLEESWRDGRVALIALEGPPRPQGTAA